eukprot:768_1
MYRLTRPITILHKSIVTKSIPSLISIHRYGFAGGSKADINSVTGLGGNSPGCDPNENSFSNPYLWDPHAVPCEEDDFERSNFFFEHGEQDRWAIPPVEQVNSGLDSNDVLKRISKILNTMERAQTDNKLIAKHTHLYNDLGLDSLDQVEFGLALESEFEIEINDEEAEQIITVGDAITYIVDHPQAV